MAMYRCFWRWQADREAYYKVIEVAQDDKDINLVALVL